MSETRAFVKDTSHARCPSMSTTHRHDPPPLHTTHSTVSEQWWDLGPLTDSEKVRLVQCRALFTPLSFPFIGEPKKTETMGKKMTH